MTKLCGIYLITHIESGRKYVGQSVDIHARWYMHSRGYEKSRFANAVRLHGWSSFKTEVLCLCERSKLNELESHWVAAHDCVSPKGFNLTTGGGQFELSAESREKLSAANRNMSPERRAKITKANLARSPELLARIAASRVGLTLTAESRKKIADSLSGRKLSDEHKAKISAGGMGRSPTQETRAKIGEAHKGRIVSDETRAKQSAYRIGKKHSAETIAQMSLDRKNPSAEVRAKMSAAHTGKKQSPELIAKRMKAKADNRLLRYNASIAAAGDLFTQH